jgi:integrase
MQRIMEGIEKYPDRPQGRRAELRAFILMLRHSGLCIGDVVSLHADAVDAHGIHKQTRKTGAVVRLPLPDSVHDAIKKLGSGFLFWSGNGLLKSAVADWQRTLGKLFEIAGVHKGHAHRFRHTFAVKLLSKGVAVNHVAAILGNSPAVVEKHYSAWVQSRQEALNEAVGATFAT